MTWVYIVLAVLVAGWAVWTWCKAMYVMGHDEPHPRFTTTGKEIPHQSEIVLCFRCGEPVPDDELGSHYCGHDDTQ